MFDSAGLPRAERVRGEWLKRGRRSGGQRSSTVASPTGHLLWNGVDAEVALELL